MLFLQAPSLAKLENFSVWPRPVSHVHLRAFDTRDTALLLKKPWHRSVTRDKRTTGSDLFFVAKSYGMLRRDSACYTIGALLVATGLWCIFDYNHNEESYGIAQQTIQTSTMELLFVVLRYTISIFIFMPGAPILHNTPNWALGRC